MPTFSNHSVFELVRGIKAFLSLNVGVTRGEVRAPEELESLLGQAHERIRKQNRQLERLRQPAGAVSSDPGDGGAAVNPENIVWILGSPRTGSTWLGRILGEPDRHVIWSEPFFGVVLGFRNNLANRGYVNSGNFLLGEPHREVWVQSMRRLFLDVCRARFPHLSPKHHLIVKEPNGSMSAPLILEAFPESKLVFLVRDSRDVVASLLDAAGKGSWYGYDRYEASAVEALRNGGAAQPSQHPGEDFVGRLARNYAANINAVKEAYDKHPDGAKVMVRYEDLVEHPLKHVSRICDALGLRTDSTQLARAVEKHSWDNVPEDEKGGGKFHRKATPGGWREDLTPEWVEIVERITAPLLDEFYPG